jgi:F-type H+-transporting ATPase subunit delta
MSQYLTIARPYAKAVFDNAVEQNQLDEWSAVLLALSTTSNEPKVCEMLQRPTTTDVALIDLFYDVANLVATAEVAALGERFINFIKLLAEHKRFNCLADIAKLYHQMLISYKKITEVDVISAFEMNKAQTKKLQKALEEKFKSKIIMQHTLDKSLIGGLIVRTDKFVMDSSLKGRLTRLETSLNS